MIGLVSFLKSPLGTALFIGGIWKACRMHAWYNNGVIVTIIGVIIILKEHPWRKYHKADKYT